jgi:hypothetical protein
MVTRRLVAHQVAEFLAKHQTAMPVDAEAAVAIVEIVVVAMGVAEGVAVEVVVEVLAEVAVVQIGIRI